MKNKKPIVGSIVGLVVIALSVSLFYADKANKEQTVSSDDPIDIVSDFYNEWLHAVESTSTDPYQLELADDPILSKALRDRLTTTGEDQEIDPVLCQNIPPTKISSRVTHSETDAMQILVLSKEPTQAGQALFVVSRLNEGWYIDDILCSQGESGAPYEFSFEHEGGLFNGSTVESLDVENHWSLLYTQDTVVYTARLIFSSDSMCTDIAGNESICDPEQFTETKVAVQGAMSEIGVEVEQLTFLQ